MENFDKTDWDKNDKRILSCHESSKLFFSLSFYSPDKLLQYGQSILQWL
jgi:hypothetical protein